MSIKTLKDEILEDRGFDQYDLNFIKRRTGLKEESQVLSLIEEDEDLGLVVDQIASLPLVKRQTARLSLRFLLLLLIHKYNQGSIKNKHKLVISRIASTYFDLIHNQMPQDCSIDFSKKPNEASANLLFVLSGFFGEYFAKFFDQTPAAKTILSTFINDNFFVCKYFLFGPIYLYGFITRRSLTFFCCEM